MAKQREVIFVCSECGEEYIKWQGKCDNCSGWNTLKEFKISQERSSGHKGMAIAPSEVVLLEEVEIQDFQRNSTQISEFDRVLGGYIKDLSLIHI